MQRIYFLAFVLLIFLSSTKLVLDLFSFNPAFANQDLVGQEEVTYELPYPGILPDSPFYFLKVIRDKTVGFLISDPLRKAEFNLLQADKRLNAGIHLFNSAKQNEKKIKLAISTISKAENYFEEALGKIDDAKMEGRNIDEMKGKLRTALKKHQQELGYMIQKVDKNFEANFKREQKRITGFEKRLSY